MFDYDALRAAPLRSHPAPYSVVKNFLRPGTLQKLLPLFPKISAGGSFPAFSFRHPPLFQQMLLEFEGKQLQREIAEKFSLSLDEPPTLLTLRGQSRPQDGRIHCDSKSKAVTILLYFNHPRQKWLNGEGCLRFVENKDPENLLTPTSPDDIIEPSGGTLVVFPNTNHSWHGHLPYIGQRRTIQLNYMRHSWRAWLEARRHALSAQWKKWHHV